MHPDTSYPKQLVIILRTSMAAAIVALAAGCGVETQPETAAGLHDYSNVWPGAIRLDSGDELPVTLSLLTSDIDDRVTTDPASPWRWVFGRLDLESEGYALAVIGVARHEEWSFDEDEAVELEDAGTPVDDREYVHFFVSSSIGQESPDDAYAADYAAFLERVGRIEAEWHSFDLNLELTTGAQPTLEGTFGEISTDEVDVEGSAIAVTWKPRGTVALAFASDLPPEARRDASTLVLDPFVYRTWVEDGELWWDVSIE